MKKLNKLLAAVLALAICLSMVVLPVSADDDLVIAPGPAKAPVDRATAQQAIIETALAYYNKGMPVQYDSTKFTIQDRNNYGGACRLTSGDSPEAGSHDHTIFSVCSDYCYDVYHDAFGYELMGGSRNTRTSPMVAISAKDPMIVCKYDGTGADPDAMTDLKAAIAKARSVLEPGDLIIGYGTSGHAMLYMGKYFIGDDTDYIIHCWGGKFDTDTGVDKVETSVKNANPEGGAIRLESVDENVFSEDGTGSWSLYKEEKNARTFVIMRPLNDPALANPVLTPAAESRLAYRGIEVDKLTDKGSIYNSVQTGDELTLNVVVTNNGKEDFKAVAIKEPLPEGAALKDGSITENGKAENGAITWTVDVPTGKSVTVSYTVTVTAKRAEAVKFSNGSVAQLTTRAFDIPVQGKPLSAEKIDKLERITADLIEIQDVDSYLEMTEMQGVNAFFAKELGIELNLPEVFNDYIEGLSFKQNVIGVSEKQGGWMWAPKAADKLAGQMAIINSMIIPEHLTGFAVYLEGSPDAVRDNCCSVNRVQEYKTEFYQPGDIFIALCDPDVKMLTKANNMVSYIYAGDGKVIAFDNVEGAYVDDFSGTVQCLLNKNYILGLRPSLAVDDVNAGIPDVSMPFTDVYKGEWYYSYVKGLYNAGIVNGMTATTFVPKGNLTYGQALKLIICGLGNDEQPGDATNWASGYLAFAKKEGWLADDVDLNKQITREQFCEIAAKAKNLTGAPAENPFLDTDNAAVLALNDAGVINGMSEDTFQPDGLLTRAQITKIISLLIKL